MWWLLGGLGALYLLAYRRRFRNPRRGARVRVYRHRYARNPNGHGELAEVIRAREAFHGVPPRSRRVVSLPSEPGALWELGRALRIDYEVEAPSDRAGTQYTHDWGDTGYSMRGDRPILAVDRAGNLWLVRDRSRYKVGRRGIVG